MTSAEPCRGWIQSPLFDTLAFILVPLSSLIVLGAVLGAPFGAAIVVAATYLVGIPHYMSSFTFFLGDDNLQYYRSRWVAFFVKPANFVSCPAGNVAAASEPSSFRHR